MAFHLSQSVGKLLVWDALSAGEDLTNGFSRYCISKLKFI